MTLHSITHRHATPRRLLAQLRLTPVRTKAATLQLFLLPGIRLTGIKVVTLLVLIYATATFKWA